jgi:hypothetical protein
MRSHPGSFRLSFLLPAGAKADAGNHQPSPEGCRLEVTFPLAVIAAPSREAAFEHAALLLRVACRGLRASIPARLETPGGPVAGDRWTIIVGADVAFSPTGLGVDFPRQHQTPPALELVRAS